MKPSNQRVPLSHFAAKTSLCNIHTDFECGNGECIDYLFTCDGIAHCKDKSDEKMQYCGKHPIDPTVLAASSSENPFSSSKISRDLCGMTNRLTSSNCTTHNMCDHYFVKFQLDNLAFSLSARSDNRNCRQGFRSCFNRRCVANALVCDGVDDCGDNSDEVYCKSERINDCNPAQNISNTAICTIYLSLCFYLKNKKCYLISSNQQSILTFRCNMWCFGMALPRLDLHSGLVQMQSGHRLRRRLG